MAVVASAGEVLQIRQGTAAGGVLTWSAPTRKRAPQTGLAYPKDQLRTRWQNGELSVSGIGCDIPGASGVTVSIVGLGGDAIPAEPASSAVLDETGGFEVVVPGVTAGDRVVVRVVLGGQQSEPALLTVPSPGTSIAAGETTLTVGPSATGDPLWRTIGLAPGSYEPGTKVRLSAGVQEAGDGFEGTRGSAGGHRPSASGWTVTVGADGGCGQRLIKLHAGVSIELIAGDADPVYSEVTGLDPETIAITMPNDAGDVTIVGAPGAAPQGSVIEADVEGGVSVRRETGDDGAFSPHHPWANGTID